MSSPLQPSVTSANSPFPAALGGGHQRQLAHLKAHRRFQKQDKHDKARLYWNTVITRWNTVITRAQSYRHITRHLNAKINLKAPGFLGPGRLATDEGQEDLKYFARDIARGPCDIQPYQAHRIPARLRRRMLRTLWPYLPHTAVREMLAEYSPRVRW